MSNHNPVSSILSYRDDTEKMMEMKIYYNGKMSMIITFLLFKKSFIE
jgi:hypothetical protein